MPDLNSVPPSPRSLASSRRQSRMATPPVGSSTSLSLNILPSNQNAVNHPQSPTTSSPVLAASHPPTQSASNEYSVGPGPLRHPRPLTVPELHHQLEKEQEAVVNRLTRELSLIRAAQNASVVSNTSSTSATNSIHEPVTDQPLLSGSGFSIPTARHQRNSSTTSLNYGSQGLSSSYDARIRPLSRQNSTASRTNQTNSPAPSSSLDPLSYFQNQRIPYPTSVPLSSVGAATPGSASEQLSPGIMAGTARYEETAFYRNELDSAKKENEILKQRIRDLERQVRQRRVSDPNRPRSESTSTTASHSVTPAGGVGIAGPRDILPVRPERERERGMTTQSVASAAGSVGIGVPDEELQVGESAASSGLANNPQK